MKRYCKNIDITNKKLIDKAIYSCLAGKLCRKDTIRLLHHYCHMSYKDIKYNLKEHNHTPFHSGLDRLALQIQKEIRTKNLLFPKIHYKNRLDSSCLKMRCIGIQNIKQQIYDYIAVEGLRPILKRIGEYQCASIPHRGQSYGVAAIKKWLRNPNMKYACKLDIRHCFESITKEHMMEFLSTYIKNDTLLWLLDTLLSTFKGGLSIGSFLSQYLCNLYISQLYHFLKEETYRDIHVLIYMDDILILGTSSNILHDTIHKLEDKASNIGLSIKPDWRIWNRTNTFIDIMGMRIYQNHITIRQRVFKKVKRAFVKLAKSITITLARRCISYYGILKHTDSSTFVYKLHINKYIFKCRRLISEYQSRIYRQTTGSYQYCME